MAWKMLPRFHDRAEGRRSIAVIQQKQLQYMATSETSAISAIFFSGGMLITSERWFCGRICGQVWCRATWGANISWGIGLQWVGEKFSSSWRILFKPSTIRWSRLIGPGTRTSFFEVARFASSQTRTDYVILFNRKFNNDWPREHINCATSLIGDEARAMMTNHFVNRKSVAVWRLLRWSRWPEAHLGS